MTETDLLQIIRNGETSTVEFKSESVHPGTLAEEIVAFSNFEGGTVFIGVEDDGTITGCAGKDTEERIVNVCRNSIRPSVLPRIEKVFTANGTVFAVSVPRSESAHATSRGQYLIRVGSTKQLPTQHELIRLFQQRRLLQYDETPVLSGTLSSIDLRLVNEYLARIGQSPLGAPETVEQELCAMSILVEIGGKCYPTFAGLLVFGRLPQDAFPSLIVRCGVYRGNDTASDTIAEKTVAGTLPQQIDDAIVFCKLAMNQKVSLSDGIHRNETFDYPLPALREAVVNAVCHRDYTITGSAIRLNVFGDRIEIRSPGRLPNTLTLQSIRYRQFTRNQAIASFLSGAGYMEQRGKGILRLEKICAEAGLSCTFSLTPDENEFVVTMGGSSQ